MNLSQLQSEFMRMEESGEVDESVVEDIEEVENALLKKMRDFSDGAGFQNFKSYFKVSTSLKILEKMKERVSKAKARGKNPEIAIISMDVLAQMSELIGSNLEKIKTGGFQDALKLQSEAREKDMFPDSEILSSEIGSASYDTADRFFDNLRNSLEV